MLNQPFFQITLPLMVTFIATVWIAQWSQNKRFDDLNKRLDKIDDKLDKIEERLKHLEILKWR
jgi:F0F1-type ATP synthase membrane subunit b/b'